MWCRRNEYRCGTGLRMGTSNGEYGMMKHTMDGGYEGADTSNLSFDMKSEHSTSLKMVVTTERKMDRVKEGQIPL
jgi:hypothetical protein